MNFNYKLIKYNVTPIYFYHKHLTDYVQKFVLNIEQTLFLMS